MRRLVYALVAIGTIVAGVSWWRAHPRSGAGFVNRTLNPWLARIGAIDGSRGELALIEHVGRRSGIVRQTPIHPMPVPGGYRVIVPIGERSEWARNVLAAGGCRLLVGERSVELDEPTLELPSEVPGLAPPVRALFGWLGFRYLRLRTVDRARPSLVTAPEAPPVFAEAVPA